MARKTEPAAALIVDPGKAALVEQERARLMALFDGADENRLDFIRDAVQQLAWLNVSIQELQTDIDEKGHVIPYQNGQTQKGLQANPSCKLLTDFQKLSNTTFRALLPVLPDRPRTGGKLAAFRDEYDELAEFRIKPMTKEEREQACKEQMETLAKIRKGIPINSDDV